MDQENNFHPADKLDIEVKNEIVHVKTEEPDYEDSHFTCPETIEDSGLPRSAASDPLDITGSELGHIIKEEIIIEHCEDEDYLLDSSSLQNSNDDNRIMCAKCEKNLLRQNFKRHWQICKGDGMKTWLACAIADCKASFSTSQALHKHRKTEHSSKTKKCPYPDCDKYFRLDGLWQHVNGVHKNLWYAKRAREKLNVEKPPPVFKILACPVPDCPATFEYVRSLERHKWSVHAEKRACPFPDCDRYLKPRILALHINSVHEKQMKFCTRCQNFIASESYDEHRSQCPMPNKGTGSKVKNVSGSRKYICPIVDCTASFELAKDFRAHKDLHKVSLVKCPDCDSYFTPIGLKRHLKKDHEKIMKKCKKCRGNILAEEYTEHLTRCRNDKKVYKTASGRKKRSKSGVSKSPPKENSESELEKYECDFADCKAAFNSSKRLEIHKNSVHADRTKCPYPDCNRYLKPRTIAQHIKAVHLKETKICENCQTPITTRWYNNHLIHCRRSKDAIYRCWFSECDSQIFKDARSAQVHAFMEHKVPRSNFWQEYETHVLQTGKNKRIQSDPEDCDEKN